MYKTDKKVTVILGPQGSGKTKLANLMAKGKHFSFINLRNSTKIKDIEMSLRQQCDRKTQVLIIEEVENLRTIEYFLIKKTFKMRWPYEQKLLDFSPQIIITSNSFEKEDLALLTKKDLLVVDLTSAKDPVTNPAHYTDGAIEVITFIEDKNFGYHIGSVVKYLSRAGKKDPSKTIQDLEKARWYLDRQISNLKKEVNNK